MNDHHAICAIATAPGRSGIGILRISGKSLGDLAARLVGTGLKPRHAHCRDFLDAEGAVIDRGIALLFPGPNSFTGEDVLELHAHGSRVVLEMLRDRALALGARLARPGEFSERAFLNGKIDLVQAEAIADLIDADSRQAARSAMRSLSGDFSRKLRAMAASLTEFRVLLESAIDFSDSDIEVLDAESFQQRLAEALADLEQTRSLCRQGTLLNQGIVVALAGLPNAGKSSVMNCLAGHDAAIVTAIPGTTRDIVSRRVLLDGLPVQLVDTAGLRDSDDEIEQEGVRRARKAIDNADLVLLICDSTLVADDPANVSAATIRSLLQPLRDCASDPGHFESLLRRVTVIWNKIDLSGLSPGMNRVFSGPVELPLLRISARENVGIDLLSRHLQSQIAYEGGEDAFAARARHVEAVDEAIAQCRKAQENMASKAALEWTAEDLRLAQAALGKITGEVTSDELLGEIFGKFCIGK